MAIAMTNTDKGISTIETSFFNTDRQKHDTIDVGYARSLIDFEVKTEPICRPNGAVVDDIYNLVRTDTDTVLPIGHSVGKEFTAVQHTKMFDFLADEILPRVPEMKLETVSTMYGGASSLITAHFGDEFHLPNDQSGIYNRLCFSNPMGRGSLVFGWTSVRVVCMNTLARSRKEMLHNAEFAFKVQHTKNSNYLVEAALDSIKEQIEEAAGLREEMTFLANTEVNTDTVNKVLDAVYPLTRFDKDGRGKTMMENARKEVLRQFEEGETAQTMDKKTAWSLFNSFTYPLIHSKETSRVDGGEIEYSSMMGNRAEKIADIFGKTMEVVRLAA